jgi:hypothetical protein
METKIKINNTYLGLTSTTQLLAQEQLDFVLGEVRKQFGERPVMVLNKTRLLTGLKYPTHFAAGWFWGEGILNPTHTSELVVVAHGDSFEDARKGLMNGMSSVYWQEDALDVDVVKSGLPLDRIFGTWPGDETNEQIEEAPEVLS